MTLTHDLGPEPVYAPKHRAPQLAEHRNQATCSHPIALPCPSHMPNAYARREANHRGAA